MKKFAKPIKLNKYSNAVKKTLYFLESPKNAERLKQANKNFKAISLQKSK